MDAFLRNSQAHPIPSRYSAAAQARYVSVTQIFDANTQNIIKEVEIFMKGIVSNKMYWTREVLQFFGIKEEDIAAFLSVHQLYKQYWQEEFLSSG